MESLLTPTRAAFVAIEGNEQGLVGATRNQEKKGYQNVEGSA
jgi:hypothetical protein